MIELFVQSRYHINREALRTRADAYLKKSGLNPNDYVVSIGIVGDRKMSILHKKYAKKEGTTPVLSFPYIQSGYKEKYHASRTLITTTPAGTQLIGEIVISYPQTLIFAADENKLVDTKLAEFVEHGLKKLLTT